MLNIVFNEVTKRNMKMSNSNEFENVLCIGYALDVGPIDYNDNMEERKDIFKLELVSLEDLEDMEPVEKHVKSKTNLYRNIGKQIPLSSVIEYSKEMDYNIIKEKLRRDRIDWLKERV